MERVAPGKLIDELIKAQHNCVSDRRTYGGNVVRIAHEKLLVFRKERGSLHFLAKVQQRAQAMQGITWRAAVRRLLQGGKTLHLKEINTQLEAYAATRANNHWGPRFGRSSRTSAISSASRLAPIDSRHDDLAPLQPG